MTEPSQSDVKFNNVDSPEIMQARFGTERLTIPQLFTKYYGDGLPIDPGPRDVRARLLFLSRMHAMVEFERAISQQQHGRSQISIWNNLRTMINKQIIIVQDVNISLMSEAKLSTYINP